MWQISAFYLNRETDKELMLYHDWSLAVDKFVVADEVFFDFQKCIRFHFTTPHCCLT